jgi:NADH dehydrogenase/NADH:ubiquinone oxidoreductase subunit G
MKKISLDIDGSKVTVEEGATVLDAARAANIPIPVLCHGDDKKPYGICRICVVEIEGRARLEASCSTFAVDGMVVRTDTERVLAARRMICEMIVSDHDADCLRCPSNTKCNLQNLAALFFGA